jgi:hypothetical protein
LANDPPGTGIVAPQQKGGKRLLAAFRHKRLAATEYTREDGFTPVE